MAVTTLRGSECAFEHCRIADLERRVAAMECLRRTATGAPPKKAKGEEVAEKWIRPGQGFDQQPCIHFGDGANCGAYLYPAFSPSESRVASISRHIEWMRRYLASAIDKAIAEEREACAKEADAYWAYSSIARGISDSIRDRK
jgi:hypothetical protein